MKKIKILLVLMLVCAVMVSCGENEAKITSSSTYVTPTMMQKLQDTADEMPESQKDEIAIQSDDSGDLDDKSVANAEESENTENTDTQKTEENTTNTAETVSKQEKPVSNVKSKTSKKANINTVSDETVVYVSKSGKKFHKTPTCSNMTSPSQMTRSEAENSGRTYCKKCYE